jgi:hypothetical protein
LNNQIKKKINIWFFFVFSLTSAVEWLTNYIKNNNQSIDPTIRLKIQDVYDREHLTNPFKRLIFILFSEWIYISLL